MCLLFDHGDDQESCRLWAFLMLGRGLIWATAIFHQWCQGWNWSALPVTARETSIDTSTPERDEICDISVVCTGLSLCPAPSKPSTQQQQTAHLSQRLKIWCRKTHMTDQDSPSTHTLDLASISPVDHRVIGLSPQYWSHTPLLIGDLTDLPLVNGVDCFLIPDGYVENASNTPKPSRRVNIIPLSRVSLRGIITAVDRRPNGCVLMVLDDGTGSIDVRCWDNSDKQTWYCKGLQL